MIRNQSGPWGHVKVTVEHRCTSTVRCWVNGWEQMPHNGLDKAEAEELADELMEDRMADLMKQFEAKSRNDITEGSEA